MTDLYVLQSGAAEDLRSIVRYTRDTWGARQSRAYAEKLRDGIERLAKAQGTHKSLSDIHQSLRVTRCGITISSTYGVKMLRL